MFVVMLMVVTVVKMRVHGLVLVLLVVVVGSSISG